MSALPPYWIAPLGEADPHAVEALLDAAFGPDRRRRTAYRIRDGMAPIPTLSYAALSNGGALLGSLQSWPVALDGKTPLILVGPVAVTPDLQRSGIGRALMQRLIDDAERSGADPLVLIGDPEFYGRFFGFTADPTGKWQVPGPVDRRRLLARLPEGRRLPEAGSLGPRRRPFSPQADAPNG